MALTEPKPETKSLPQVLSELKDMTITYARQETIDPLKNLGRFVGLGVIGSVLLGIGGVLVALAFLRFLQTETGPHLTGNLTWIPYLATLALVAVFALVALKRITAKPREDRTEEFEHR